MPVKLIHPRARLRKYLEGQLKLIEQDGLIHRHVLEQAVEGLVALDYGECQPMFAPGRRKNSRDGTRPFTLRKLRMEALGFADLLIKNKFTGDEAAIRTVAGAYGEKADTFRAWRKSPRLGKASDQRLQAFRAEVSGREWDKSSVMADLKAAGAKYRAARYSAHQ